MKKLFLILAAAVVLSSVAVADKSRFYEGGKVIDTMYVDSEDGLRARDFPSLKSARLCSLPHRLPVKVVAVGREETIDGMTAPWVEILLPCHEWRGSEAEFGWVFGGYLSKEIPEFIAPRNAKELENYLQFAVPVISNELFPGLENKTGCGYPYFFFYKKHTFLSILDMGLDFENFTEGSYECTSKDSVTITYAVGAKLKTLELKFYNIQEESFCVSSVSGDSEGLRILFSGYISDNVFNHLVYSFIGNKFYFKENHSSVYGKLGIEYGADCSGVSDLERQYHDYWNPIMAEHQKKADEMK